MRNPEKKRTLQLSVRVDKNLGVALPVGGKGLFPGQRLYWTVEADTVVACTRPPNFVPPMWLSTRVRKINKTQSMRRTTSNAVRIRNK